jgi:hypothetical protein
MEQTSQYCPTCRQITLHARSGTNHVLHLLLTLFLCGFWLPVWILCSVKIGGWRCQTCGDTGSVGSRLIVPVAAIVMLILLPISFLWMRRGVVADHSAAATEIREVKGGSDSAPPKPARPEAKQTKPEAQATKPETEVAKPETEPSGILSLDGMVLPITLVTTAPITFLNAEGKETAIPAGSVIKIAKRSDKGTMTMQINGALYVGNEMRLSGKVKRQ